MVWRSLVKAENPEYGCQVRSKDIKVKRLANFSADDWSEVGDLLDQCIEAADVDSSYSRLVRDKAIKILIRTRNKAVDKGLRLNLVKKLKKG